MKWTCMTSHLKANVQVYTYRCLQLNGTKHSDDKTKTKTYDKSQVFTQGNLRCSHLKCCNVNLFVKDNHSINRKWLCLQYQLGKKAVKKSKKFGNPWWRIVDCDQSKQTKWQLPFVKSSETTSQLNYDVNYSTTYATRIHLPSRSLHQFTNIV